MAFGLFKKKNYADCIFVNGNVDTKDWENPKASAIAVKNGIIMRVGENEDMEDLQGPDTVVTDLQGKYVKPGMIDLYAEPAGSVLNGTYLRLSEEMSREDVASALSLYISSHPQSDFYFGYGYSTSQMAKEEENTTDFRIKLDEMSPEKPIVLLASDDLNMRINTVTAQIIKDRADEIGLDNYSPRFIMDCIVSTDYETCAAPFMEDCFNTAKLGITTRFSCENSPYLDSIYRDILISIFSDGLAKQRYFGSYPIKKKLPPQSYTYAIEKVRTSCQELVPLINFNTACITCSSDPENQYYMDKDYLAEMAEELSDRNISMRFYPLDRNIAIACLDIGGELSEKNKKITVSIVHDYEFTQEELAEVYSGNIIQLPVTDDITEAEAIGLTGKIGIISEGAYADFAVFDSKENKEADMTVLAGNVIYTKDSTLDSWIEECNSTLASFTDDLSAMKESEETEEFEEFEESEEPEALETEESEASENEATADSSEEN